MTENSLLRIGDFARASWLSIKALRRYHEIGLLVPAEVDPRTGYRAYSAVQLIDAAVIRRLRQLDVPLESIRAVLDARDPAVTRKVLAEQAARLQGQLDALQRSIEDLHRAADWPGAHTPVHRRFEPSRPVLMMTGTVTEDEFTAFLARARGVLVAAAGAADAPMVGSFGGCYPPLLDDNAQDVVAFVPVARTPLLPKDFRSAGVRVGELPATETAVLTHVGGYETLEDSYRTLGTWVAANAEPVDLPVRELYVVGDGDTDAAENFRTEICWPIASA